MAKAPGTNNHTKMTQKPYTAPEMQVFPVKLNSNVLLDASGSGPLFSSQYTETINDEDDAYEL